MDLSSALPADLFDYRFAIAAGVAVAAGLMRGFSGFGSAMMLSPVYAILYGPTAMVVIVTIMEMVISFQLAPGARKDAQWDFVVPVSIAALVCAPIGIYVLTTVDPELLTRGVAGVVLAFVLVMASGWRYDGPKRLAITIAVGALAGVVLATTSMGGPLVLIYMLTGPDKAVTNRANIIVYFLIVETGLVLLMLFQDLIAPETAIRAAALVPIYMAAGYIGARGFRMSSEKLYRRVALAVLACVALFGLFR
jgi:uncharacterized membrane protein YfcA